MGSTETEVAVLKEKVRQLEDREKDHIKVTGTNTKNITEIDKRLLKVTATVAAIVSVVSSILGAVIPHIVKLFM